MIDLFIFIAQVLTSLEFSNFIEKNEAKTRIDKKQLTLSGVVPLHVENSPPLFWSYQSYCNGTSVTFDKYRLDISWALHHCLVFPMVAMVNHCSHDTILLKREVLSWLWRFTRCEAQNWYTSQLCVQNQCLLMSVPKPEMMTWSWLFSLISSLSDQVRQGYCSLLLWTVSIQIFYLCIFFGMILLHRQLTGYPRYICFIPIM